MWAPRWEYSLSGVEMGLHRTLHHVHFCYRTFSIVRFRYFLARILDNVGVTDNHTKNLVNLANTLWGFANATLFALTVSKYPRRRMYLVSLYALPPPGPRLTGIVFLDLLDLSALDLHRMDHC